ncbi:MAG TPA: phenylalanine--tRNA ligase subunit beta, partial [Candidatus Limnocylindrales bacterium]|nr:phenylalanine--tRNA ligase subunit beta [Candidatus Limnocylindrales bacterium]
RNDAGLVQVVCGAPNVQAGMLVVWLPPGATVPSTYEGDPFVLGARELRGITSNGMLASPKELAIGDSHEGILELDEAIEPGTAFGAYYGLVDDAVIDIENKMFTHRPDCFGWLGVAREIAGIQGQAYQSPSWYTADAPLPESSAGAMQVTVRNEIPELVPRFVVVPLDSIKVAPSPVWLQIELSKVGLRPINNVVDLTNYYMLLTGQPLHAYDYDKVVAQDPGATAATIVVRNPHESERLTLLNGKDITPRADAILIASATRAIGLGGVMGGGDTEVDATTTRIILECASFDMYSIRRTSMAHGIFSDAVTRFNKGQSPLQNRAVAARVVRDFERYTDGRVAGPVVDDVHLGHDVLERRAVRPDVSVEVAFINQRLGLELATEDIVQLLMNVECKVEDIRRTMVDETDGTKIETDILTIRAPFWRTDIEIPEDIVEEVGRLHGFDKLPLQLPKRDLIPAVQNERLALKAALRKTLRQSGANELLTYSFVHERLLTRAGQDPTQAYQLSNALSPDLQYYRLSLTPSLLDRVHTNVRAGYDTMALYELGKSHVKGQLDADGLPEEFNRLALVFAATPKAAQSYAGASYYQARLYLDTVLSTLGSDMKLTYQPLHQFEPESLPMHQLLAPFEPNRSAVVSCGDTVIGVVGEYKATVRRAFKLPEFAAGFEIDTAALKLSNQSSYVPVPRFPKIEQDVCLRVSADTPYEAVHATLRDALQTESSAYGLMKLGLIDIFQREDDVAHKQITFRLTIASDSRTLTDAEVTGVLQRAAENVSAKLDARIV